MIQFAFPYMFLLILPWTILFFFLYGVQESALRWLRVNISDRFLETLTRYKDKRSIVSHLLLLYLMGIFLLIAATGPMLPSVYKIDTIKGNIVLLIDGSSSMVAGDTFAHPITNKKPYDRFAQAQEFCVDLIEAEPNYSYGLITFSGIAVSHNLPTSDLASVLTSIQAMKMHNFEMPGS
ncbi:MAG: VWA domain-containing protein, partial [Leptospiraceae bacterium]|nr:VWA domain-containing protein [Leptospiraceae bacterium]